MTTNSSKAFIGLCVTTLVLSGCSRRDEHSMTPLMYAAQRGDTTEIKRLLKRSTNTESAVKPHGALREWIAFLAWMQELPKRNPGWTALMFAVDSSRYDAARILLDNGASPSVNANGMTPMSLAVFKRNRDMVRLLTEHGASLAGTVGYMGDPLFFAAERNDTALLRLFLVRGGRVDSKDPSGLTPLMVAAQAGSADAADLLLHAGANVDLQGPNGWRAARFARESGHTQLAEKLGASVDAQTDLHNAELFAAIKAGDVQATFAALERGANPNALQEQGRSVLMEAASKLPEAALFDLIEAGAEIRKSETEPILFLAVVLNHHKLFERMLVEGAKPHDSLITDAVRAGHVSMVKRLLAMRLDPNARDAMGHTALELARLNKNQEMVALLEAVPGAH